MINAVFDLSIIFYKCVHYLQGKNKSRVFLETERDAIEMIQGVHGSIQGDLYKYKSRLDRVFLVADSNMKSWRKIIKVEGDKFYKVKKKDYKFDYSVFLEHMNAYCTIMEEKNIYMLQYNHAEGDDLIYLLTNRLWHQDCSSIIYTADSDLRQLIRTGDKKFIYLYDTNAQKRRMYIDKEIPRSKDVFEPEESTIESLDNDNGSDFGGIFGHTVEGVQQDIFESMLNEIYDSSEVIDPNLVIFSKMLAGDISDGVPSSYRYMYGKKNPKLQNFTDKRAKGVWDKINKNKQTYAYFIDLYMDDVKRKDLAEFVIDEVKQEITPEAIQQIANNIRRNLKFIFLNKIVYHPDHIKEMTQYVDEIINDDDLMIKHKHEIRFGFQNDLLQGTKYQIGATNKTKDFDQKM